MDRERALEAASTRREDIDRRVSVIRRGAGRRPVADQLAARHEEGRSTVAHQPAAAAIGARKARVTKSVTIRR
jgi:hypothetical protein